MCVVIRDDRAGSIGKGWTNNRLHAYFHCTVYTVQPVETLSACCKNTVYKGAE